MNTTSTALSFMFLIVIPIFPGRYIGIGLYPSKIPDSLRYASAYGKVNRVREHLKAHPHPLQLDDALMRASQGGHVAVVELLVASGANINNEKNGWNSLMYAIANGQLQVAETLRNHGAAALTDTQLQTMPEHTREWYEEINHPSIKSNMRNGNCSDG